MKIAVASVGTEVGGHFGHCEHFRIYTVEDGKILGEELVPNPEHKPGFLPNFLGDMGVEVVIAGKEKKDRILGDKEKQIVAYHEVGHALVMALQKESEPVQKITIVPRTMGALGYTMQRPEEEKYLNSKEEMLAVSGVGEFKYEKYGQRFLECVRAAAENPENGGGSS